MTDTNITPARSAARRDQWTAAEDAAYQVGRLTMNAQWLGYTDGRSDRSPYGDLSGPSCGGLLDVLQLTGPGRPRLTASYRALLAQNYREGRLAGLESAATPWTGADDDGLADLAELGYDDEARS